MRVKLIISVFCLAVLALNSFHPARIIIPFAGTPLICIQPFNGIPSDLVDHVFSELKKIYPNIELENSIALPGSAWYAPRKRYRADSLINYLGRNTKEGRITLGLTAKDISTTKDKYPDWGVMGLGFCPGNACVVSTFRLKKDDLSDQLFKVSIHELGHTQGLDHCPVKTCFMRDAEGGNPTNEEKEFCTKCRSWLEAKGWKF